MRRQSGRFDPMKRRGGRRAPALWTRGAVVAALGVAVIASAGSLSGPILDGGVTAELVDVVQLPASANSATVARINMLKEAPDGSGRLFINDLRGEFYSLTNGTLELYLDLAALRPDLKTAPGLASGFVSFAFHPEFAANGLFYTVHTEFVGAIPATMGPALATAIDQHSVLTEWTATVPSAGTFSGSSRELIRVASPHRFHNLGEVGFNPYAQPADPDYGLLYVGGGDYGAIVLGQPDQLQRLDTPMGALMRIDPLGGTSAAYSYGIPASNPYAGDGDPLTMDEIYAHGFRNGHRITWRSDELGGPIVSDIGESNLEEINLLVAGANYGWPEREGTFALDPVLDPSTVFPLPPDDASFGYAYPVAQFDHEEGRAIAGGVANLNPASGALFGQFVFGDIVTGRILYAGLDALLAADDGVPATTAQVFELNLVRDGVSTTLLDVVRGAVMNPGLNRVDLRLATDGAGTLYIMTKQDGFVRRLVLDVTVPSFPFPAQVLLVFVLMGLAAIDVRFRVARNSG